MVSDTKSDARSEIATVKAKGLNSSPISPPTKAIGRNTATVVMVEAVMALDTSRTAVSTAFLRGSP